MKFIELGKRKIAALIILGIVFLIVMVTAVAAALFTKSFTMEGFATVLSAVGGFLSIVGGFFFSANMIEHKNKAKEPVE